MTETIRRTLYIWHSTIQNLIYNIMYTVLGNNVYCIYQLFLTAYMLTRNESDIDLLLFAYKIDLHNIILFITSKVFQFRN